MWGGEALAPELYELIAMGMRYWFVLLALLIALYCWRWLRADRKDYLDALALLPDAGLVGELVDLYTGENFPLNREGTLGSARSCDIRILGLHKREAVFEFEDGKGVKVIPLRSAQKFMLDGVSAPKGGHALHGTRIAIGERLFRVRLFAGLDVPDRIAPISQDIIYPDQPEVTYSQEGLEEEPQLEAMLMEEGPIDAIEETSQYTWQYAVPPELLQKQPTVEEYEVPVIPRHSRSLRHRRKKDEG